MYKATIMFTSLHVHVQSYNHVYKFACTCTKPQCTCLPPIPYPSHTHTHSRRGIVRRQKELINPLLFEVAHSGNKDLLFKILENGDDVNPIVSHINRSPTSYSVC